MWFVITSGPNDGTTGGPVAEDATGHASFTYSDAGGAGMDSIQAYTLSLVADPQYGYSCSNPVSDPGGTFYRIYSDPVTKAWCSEVVTTTPASGGPPVTECPPGIGVPQFGAPVALVSAIGLLIVVGLSAFKARKSGL